MEKERTTEELALEVREHGAPAYMELWKRVRGFAFWIGKRYAGIDAADKEQAAHEALLRTVRSYDAGKGPFITAYKFALHGAYLTAKYGGRSEKTKQDPLHTAASLDAPAAEDSDTPLVDFIADERDSFTEPEAQELTDAVHNAIAKLSEGERAVILCLFFRGLTQDGAAAALKITTAEVRRREAAALRRLRHPDISRALKTYL